MAKKATSLDHFFWQRVKVGGGCWEWNGAFESRHKSYGQIMFKRKIYAAHRVAWKIWNEESPNGLCVCHKCDNPKCVRPDHLFLGTQKENLIDMTSKGRRKSCKGEIAWCSKLKESDIPKIRKLHAGGMLQKDIAKQFNVADRTICSVVNGTTWSHV